MRFLLMGLFFIITFLFVIGIAIKIYSVIKNVFFKEEQENQENYLKKIINNYFENRNISNENNDILKLMVRDILKSKKYHDLNFRYKIVTVILSTIYVAIISSIAILFYNSMNSHSEVLITLMCFTAILVGIFSLKKRSDKKNIRIFRKIPLNKKQVDKLKSLNVNNTVRKYIAEKSDFEHAFNAEDLIFISRLIN